MALYCIGVTCSKPGGGTSQYLQVRFFLVLLGEWLREPRKGTERNKDQTLPEWAGRSRQPPPPPPPRAPVLLVVPGGAAAVPALAIAAAAALLSAAAASVFAPAAVLVAPAERRAAAAPLLVSLPLSFCRSKAQRGTRINFKNKQMSICFIIGGGKNQII